LKAIGEFTVIVDIGQNTKNDAAATAKAEAIELLTDEFGRMTYSGAQTRRQALAELARKYGVTTKEAYRAIEEAKRSGV
jgi:hypothetical protein